jgi:hypothetical protein
MSDSVSSGNVEQAQAQLDGLCCKVGLRFTEGLPESKSGIVAPRGTALWSSSYAYLLLWPLASTEPSAIRHGASEAEGWFDEVLERLEASSLERAIDGYLVLALPQAPADDAREEVRRIELSSQICRKHLIWPGAAGEEDADVWRRIADVTVLGLPDAETAAAAELFWPDLDKEAQAIWDDLVILGALAVAQKDETA